MTIALHYSNFGAMEKIMDSLKDRGFRPLNPHRTFNLHGIMKNLKVYLKRNLIFENYSYSIETLRDKYYRIFRVILVKSLPIGKCYVAQWRHHKGYWETMHIELKRPLPNFYLGVEDGYGMPWEFLKRTDVPPSEYFEVRTDPSIPQSDYDFLSIFVEYQTKYKGVSAICMADGVISIYLLPLFGRKRPDCIDDFISTVEKAQSAPTGHFS